MDDFDEYMEKERQRARRRLGVATGEPCEFPNCSEADPLHLTRSTGVLLCDEHDKVRRGQVPVEQHHPATKAVEPKFTVPTFGNDHRVLTVMQRRWLPLVKSVESSAMVKDLARMASAFDNLRLIIEKYSPTVANLTMICLWWDQTRPGWWQEFERWLTSEEWREP